MTSATSPTPIAPRIWIASGISVGMTACVAGHALMADARVTTSMIPAAAKNSRGVYFLRLQATTPPTAADTSSPPRRRRR